MLKSLRVLSFVLAAGALPAALLAATVIHLELDQLVHNSQLIFYGTVEKVQVTDVGDETGHQVVTDVTFRIMRILKGSHPQETFTLRQIGGTVGDFTLLIPGQPTFIQGEETVLFLEWTGQQYTLCGLAQGRFLVTRDETGRKMAHRSFAGLAFVDPGPGSDPQVRTLEAEPPLPLDELFTRIRQTVREESKP